MLGRLFQFSKEAYEPKLHLLFAALWSLSVMGMFVTVADSPVEWLLDGKTLRVVFSFYLVLFFLRAIDEIKDYDYDALYKPDRPLVRGSVSFRDVWYLAIFLFIFAVVISLTVDTRLAIFVAINMSYGLWLMVWERLSKTVRDNILINLIVTFPVSSALNFFALMFVLISTELSATPSMVGIAIAYICAFLHYDFGRKSVWPSLLEEGEQMYSRALGGWGSGILTLALGLGGCFLVALLAPGVEGGFEPRWTLLLPAIISLYGSIQYLKSRTKRRSLRPIYMAYLVSFYTSNLIIAFNQ